MAFIVKSKQVGRKTVWGVYDTEEASWPGQRPPFGVVKQDCETEEEAAEEAARLTRLST